MLIGGLLTSIANGIPATGAMFRNYLCDDTGDVTISN